MDAERGLDRQEVGVGVGEAVLGHIQALDLLLRAGAQTDRRLDELENGDHAQHGIGTDGEHAQGLYAELPETAAVEQALHAVGLVAGEQADRKRAPDPVDAVDRHRADRIVHMEEQIQPLGGEIHDHARDETDDPRAERVRTGAARGDRDEPGQ